MGHKHHSSVKKRPTRRMLVVLFLTAAYMVAEAVGGYASHSLALLADAGHMLADVAALCISLFAIVIVARPSNYKASYGYYRAEVLAALFNGVVLILMSFFIVKEALARLLEPVAVDTNTMVGVAFGGLLVNIIGLLLLHRDKSHNLNIRGAWLHVLSDALGSVGVVVSGLLMHFWGFDKADALASMAIASLIFYSASSLVWETLGVLMEHTPAHIDPRTVKQAILAIPHAKRVHDLHIWSITSGRVALSAHVEMEPGGDSDQLLAEVQHALAQQFAIAHATIQIEKKCLTPDKNCH